MSFRNCILGKVSDGLLDKKKAEALIKKFDRKVEQFKVRGRPEHVAIQAAEQMLQTEAKIIQQKHINHMRAAVKQLQWNKWANETPGSIEKKAGDTIQRAAFRGETVYKGALHYLNGVADSLKVNWAGLSKRSHETVMDAWRVAMGEGSENVEASKLGQAMRASMDYLETGYRNAGGILGHIENYMPQVSRKEAILKAKISEEDFVNDAFRLNDLSKILDDDTGTVMTERKFRILAQEAYKDIISDGRYSASKKTKKGESGNTRQGDLDTRRKDSRFFKFKNADAFFEWNKKYGYGDEGLAQAFLEHMKSMSRDIGTMEIMGPRPTSLMRFIDSKMGPEGSSPVKRKWVNAQYRVLTSSFQHGDTNAMWWKIFAGTQNWLRAAKLGAASLSALSDTTFIAATAKMNGLNATRALKNYVMSVAPGDREIKRIATRSAFIGEALSGSAIGDTRFADEAMSTGFTRVLANAVNSLSGLQHLTKATQDSMALEAMATLGESMSAGKRWADMDPELRGSMEKFGFNEKDWDDLKLTDVYDNGDAQFLITSELRSDKKLTPKRSKEIADKIDDWTFMLRQAAANEQLVATRALTTGAFLGDGGLATPSRVVGGTFGLFKSFPLTVMMTHLIPQLREAGLTPSTMSKTMGERRFQNLALTLAGTTMLGAAVVQLKALKDGKSPKDMFYDDSFVPTPKFVFAALLQGGGLGLFGDFFFGDYSRFGRNPITEALGPTVGLFEDIYTATKGNLDKLADDPDSPIARNIKRDLFKVVRQNIPIVSSLWYTRLATERLFLDQLERMIDPGFDQRVKKYERKMKKETGQEFWWAPGKTSP